MHYGSNYNNSKNMHLPSFPGTLKLLSIKAHLQKTGRDVSTDGVTIQALKVAVATPMTTYAAAIHRRSGLPGYYDSFCCSSERKEEI